VVADEEREMPLSAQQVEAMNRLSDAAALFRQVIEDACGRSRELSIALTKIDEAEMWAHRHFTK
jgi:hypothetical protein